MSINTSDQSTANKLYCTVLEVSVGDSWNCSAHFYWRLFLFYFYFFINKEPLSTFTFMHLEDVFIQSDLRYIQAIHLLSVCVFPGNWTHNLLAANAMFYHWATGTLKHQHKINIHKYKYWCTQLISRYTFIPLCALQSFLVDHLWFSPTNESVVFEVTQRMIYSCTSDHCWLLNSTLMTSCSTSSSSLYQSCLWGAPIILANSKLEHLVYLHNRSAPVLHELLGTCQ